MEEPAGEILYSIKPPDNMTQFSTDPPYLKRAVQFTLREKMLRINATDQHYKLTDLAYGLIRLVPPGYSYPIEHARTRKKVGFFVGEKGYREDPLTEYGFVQLSSGETFEFEQHKDPNAKNQTFISFDMLGFTTIRHQGEVIGACRVIGYGKHLGLRYENAWELTLNGKLFGTVRCNNPLSWDESRIIRSDGSPILLPIHRQNRFEESFYLLWRILSLRFLYAPPMPNPDLVIPESVQDHLTSEEIPFYFAVSLLFRIFWSFFNRRDP